MNDRKIHEICFRNVFNDWDSALPVGNGHMGAMVFVREHELHVAVNHYDCYYQALPGLQKGKAGGSGTFQDPARFAQDYELLRRKTDLVRRSGDSQRSHYARTLHPETQRGRPSYQGASYPVGGELILTLEQGVDLGNSCLRLRIEEAVVIYEAGTGDLRVTAQITAARDQDGILICLTQTRDGLWKAGNLVRPSSVGLEPCKVEYEFGEWGMCMRSAYGRPAEHGENSIRQELALCLRSGGDWENVEGRKEALTGGLLLKGLGNRITAVLSLQPEKGRAVSLARELAKRAGGAERKRQEYWRQFWTAAIHLPDPFLEKLWVLQLYLLECSCAGNGRYPEQTCGLSGLWDIRRPNMWGSMWYWDVNIQSTFWGCGCAGHPELLKVFCDGYLAYEQEIREYTRSVYQWDGWALDYPHPLYHCIQPWCAQFLWQYYEYSGDVTFLEQKAYPVFQEQIAFFKRLSRRDERGIRHIDYDISPEQGPVTMDSVITISCIRRLLSITVQASEILNRPEEEAEELKALLGELPRYPVTADGHRYKDSLLAPEQLFLRHPSLLMPLFPAQEAGVDSQKEELERWEQTLQYAAEHTETGTFGMGWLAAAAARLGRGKTALRLIYEKGLDFILHTNGLAYEESERFLNYCHLTKPAHYLPVMMEAAGGLVNAVNQMLLQTGNDGRIRVFPAVPGDTPDLMESIVQYREDEWAVEGQYGGWEDASFEDLLAPGGFRVSAIRKRARTVYLKVESSREAVLRLELPRELSENGCGCVIERKMKAGGCVCWGHREELDQGVSAETGRDNDWKPGPEVLCHVAARTHRRIFLGADRHTAYYQAVDAFTCAYLLANDYRYMQTPYIFDFGTGEGEKNYEDSYPRQLAIAGGCPLYAAGPVRLGAQAYCPERGFGFRQAEDIRAVDRGRPDELRRDFLEGEQEAVFGISLPKGKYDFLLICGDEAEASCTWAGLAGFGTRVSTGRLEAGSYGCRILPVALERDGELRIHLTAAGGCKWKLNAMFINKIYGMP